MGMVSSKSKLAAEHRTATEAGFHRCWYPVALARDLPPGSVIGRDFLGTRVVVFTAGPARMADDFAIDLPYPRSLDMKTHEAFGVYTRRIYRLLGMD